MRGALFVAAFALLTTAFADSADARQAVRTHIIKVAPADEYFGRLKMSILGVRNSLKDITARIALHPERSGDQFGAATMVEDAIHDWERKYPQDSWLPKSVYQLSQVYAAIRTDDGQRGAARTLRWLVDRYPSTAYAATARVQISSQDVK